MYAQNSTNSGTIIGLYVPANSNSNSNRRLQQAMEDLADASLGQRLGYAMSEAFILDALADIEANEQTRRRQLSTGMPHRRLQNDVCQIYFNETIFRGNAQGSTQGITTYGLITLQTEGHFLSLDSCLFAENIFGIEDTNVRSVS